MDAPEDRRDLRGVDVEDPDALGADVLSLVGEAAVLLRDDEPDRREHADRVVAKVRREAAMTAIIKAFGGSAARVARSAPDLLGFGDG